MEKLHEEYLHLTKGVLSSLAKQRKFPVLFNHYLFSIIYSDAVGTMFYIKFKEESTNS